MHDYIMLILCYGIAQWGTLAFYINPIQSRVRFSQFPVNPATPGMLCSWSQEVQESVPHQAIRLSCSIISAGF